MLARRLPGAEDCLAGHARCTECNMCCAAARCLQLLSASAALRLPTAIVTKSGSCRSAAFRKSAACCLNVLYLSHALTPCRFSGEFSIFQDESKAGGPSFPSAGPRAAVSAPASVLMMLHVLRCGNANSGTRLQLRRTCARKTCRYVCIALRRARSLIHPSHAGSCHVEHGSHAASSWADQRSFAWLCARRVRRRRHEPAACDAPISLASRAAQARCRGKFA